MPESAREVAKKVVLDLGLPVAVAGVTDDTLARYLDDAVDYITSALTAYAEQAVAEEMEKAARLLDDEVKRHRDAQRTFFATDEDGGHIEAGDREYNGPLCGERGYFCENYGCGTLEEFAAKIRQRATPPPGGEETR